MRNTATSHATRRRTVFRSDGGTIEGRIGFRPLLKPCRTCGTGRSDRCRGTASGGYFGLGQDKKNAVPPSATAPDTGADREMGSALRSVYQRTVDEKVPDDLLDLLGKLS